MLSELTDEMLARLLAQNDALGLKGGAFLCELALRGEALLQEVISSSEVGSSDAGSSEAEPFEAAPAARRPDAQAFLKALVDAGVPEADHAPGRIQAFARGVLMRQLQQQRESFLMGVLGQVFPLPLCSCGLPRGHGPTEGGATEGDATEGDATEQDESTAPDTPLH